jgi:hypothetical protein
MRFANIGGPAVASGGSTSEGSNEGGAAWINAIPGPRRDHGSAAMPSRAKRLAPETIVPGNSAAADAPKLTCGNTEGTGLAATAAATAAAQKKRQKPGAGQTAPLSGKLRARPRSIVSALAAVRGTLSQPNGLVLMLGATAFSAGSTG